MLAMLNLMFQRQPRVNAERRQCELELTRAARRSTSNYIKTRMAQAELCSDREEVLDLARGAMPNHGLVCEFGVFQGRTISYLARRIPSRIVFGFDSFEGLPENWRGRFIQGA